MRVRKVIYTGHASTISSVENAGHILDQIGQLTNSEDVLPFALKIVVGEDTIEIAEDNNEFACGNALAKCLDGYEGHNIMVCVSRHVEGCFVSDMIQHLKIRAVKEAALSALEALCGELTSQKNQNFLSSSALHSDGRETSPIDTHSLSDLRNNLEQSMLKASTLNNIVKLDPFSNPISARDMSKRGKTKGKLMKASMHLSGDR